MSRDDRVTVIRGIKRIAKKLGEPVTTREDAVLSQLPYNDLCAVRHKIWIRQQQQEALV